MSKEYFRGWFPYEKGGIQLVTDFMRDDWAPLITVIPENGNYHVNVYIFKNLHGTHVKKLVNHSEEKNLEVAKKYAHAYLDSLIESDLIKKAEKEFPTS